MLHLVEFFFMNLTIMHGSTNINPFPLSAAKRFSHLKLSVCNPSYLSPTVAWMYAVGLNLRRTVPNCPQLMPAVALTVVPTIFAYTLVLKILHLNRTTWEGAVTLANTAVGKHTHPVENRFTSYFSEVKYMCFSNQIENYSKLQYYFTRKKKTRQHFRPMCFHWNMSVAGYNTF